MRETFIKRFAVCVALAMAAGLAGCASYDPGPAPLSYEEKVWFDKAVGHDILPVRSSLPIEPEYGPGPRRAPLYSRY